MDRALLLALQHADSAFPSGGFAFSQGLEGSAAMHEGPDPFDAQAFIDVQFRHRWLSADRVALVRAHRANGCLASIAALDEEIEASTAIPPIREGSRRNGRALLVTHARMGLAEATRYRERIRQRGGHGHLAVMQGYLWQAIGIPLETAVHMGAYQCLSSLFTAALRLGLVGALEAQGMLSAALSGLVRMALPEIADDQPLTSFTPLAEIAVMNHGRSGQRLFSN